MSSIISVEHLVKHYKGSLTNAVDDISFSLPLALGFMMMIAVLFTALGTAIASVLEDMQGF